MIKFLGSTYQYQGEQLTSPEIIYIVDHHYNENDLCFPVKKLLDNSICDPKLHTLAFDHVLRHEDELADYHCVFVPYLLARETENFKNQNIQYNWFQKTKTFNFMINKPRLHREFLLILLTHFGFNKNNYSYSLPWRNININRQHLSTVTTNAIYQDIIDKTAIDIANTDYVFGPEVVMDRGVRNGSFKNAQTYQGLLQTTVFEPSCYSLITEPAFYERETIITEKTIMAIYGGTMPIWVGGWRIADWMRDQGFDVFDDIIDHSYQNLSNPMDRCYEAVYRNHELLQDFNTSKKFIEYNRDRLQHNLDLLEKNNFLTECKEKQQMLGMKLF